MESHSNVAAFLAEQAVRAPDVAAVRAPLGRAEDGGIRYAERSFAALEAESSAAAWYFHSRGVDRGSRVLLLVRPGLDLVRTVFALFKIGAVPVVIDPGMGLRSFLRCVRHSGPEAVVAPPFVVRMLRCFPASFRTTGTRIPLGPRLESGLEHFSDAGSFPALEAEPDELAAVLFTSGSTGAPKGVRYAHGMFAAQVASIRAAYGIGPGEVDLPMLPVFALFNPALGMTTVVPEMNPSRPASVDPEKIVRAIRQNAVTNSFGSPTLWRIIADYCGHRGIELPSLRRVLMAGAPVPHQLLRGMRKLLPNGTVHTPYGATEALPVSSIDDREILGETAEATARGAGSCVGRPLPGVEARILEARSGPLADWSGGRELKTGEVGEIVVSGPSVTESYDRLPEADAASKIRDGGKIWHRMGDLGWLDEKGRLWFCGRKAERVETGDGPLHTDRCEVFFNAHPGVARSALIGVADGRAGIAVEPEKGAFPRTRRARARFREELREIARANPMTSGIAAFYFVRRFPVDVRHNAKIHRLALARRFAGSRAKQTKPEG